MELGDKAIMTAAMSDAPAARSRVVETLYMFTRVSIGVLLVIAGTIKLAPWGSIALTDWLVLPPILAFLIGVYEYVLGVAVLSFTANRWLYHLVIGTFLVYLVTLALQIFSGESVCQCLGSRSLPIASMLGVDLVLVTSVWYFRLFWRCRFLFGERGFLKQIFSYTRYALPVLLLLGIAAFGSVHAATSCFAGARLVAASPSHYVGALSSGELGTAIFQLTNYSGRDIHVLGAKATCMCLALQDLPLNVPPGESRSLCIKLRGKRSDEPVLQREAATLIFDDPTRMLVLTVTASIKPPS